MPPRGSQGAAEDAAVRRAADVANDYHVSCHRANVQFFRPVGSTQGATFGPGSRVQVDVTCSVGANTLALLHWQGLDVRGAQLEEVDPFRSLNL
jgi:hypothetical protein